MVKINTVLGDIDTSELGFTLMHEHLVVSFPNAIREYPELLVPNVMDHVVNGLKTAKEGGIDTVFDMTTLDQGRDIEFTREVSKRSGVNIVACTGWWLDIPRFLTDTTPGITAKQMAESFIREIDKGIGNTSVKPGILKSASGENGVTAPQETGLRAVAKAHLQTGIPIALHSYHPGQTTRQQLDILVDEGVNLKYVKIDHVANTTDIEYLTWILNEGCYLGLEPFPGHSLSPLERGETVKILIESGFIDRICPSHDCLLGYILPEGIPCEAWEGDNPYRYLYLKKVIFPVLREMGVPNEEIQKLCITGPRNFLEGK